MMNASDQSETTSLTPSWPTSPKRSARPVVYYVHSPTSHDEEGATPRSLVMMIDSPSSEAPSAHSNSVSSSASRVSGSVNARLKSTRKGGGRWRVIEEEDEEDVEDGDLDEGGRRRRGQVWVGVTAFVAAFGAFCLVIWAATKPFPPHVSLQKLIVNDFYAGQGMDWRGVPTRMLTVNCLLRMRVHNPATFFGIHVSSTSFNLRYYDLTVASGQMEEYYQPRKSWRNSTVEIKGDNVPLYGASTGFLVANDTHGVPLRLEFEVRTRGDVVGMLVRSKHHHRISCSLTMNPSDPKSVEFVGNSCRYSKE